MDTQTLPPAIDGDDPQFWDGLIDEGAAAKFLALGRRTLQGFRQQGGGPNFFRLSARAVRYRRRDLRAWAESRQATSTAEYV